MAGSLAFPVTEIGSRSKLDIVVANCGTLVLSNFSAMITGTDPGTNDFKIVQTTCPLGSAVPISGTCTLTIEFKPTAARMRPAFLTLSGDGITNQNVQLTGTGKAPAPLICIPNNLYLDCGAVVLGSHTAQSVVVTNCGTALLTIGSIDLSGPDASKFQIVTDGCSHSDIPPGGICSFSVVYTPTTVGSASATVTINDNTATGTHSINLGGQCVNTQPDASISSKLTPKSFVGKGVFDSTGTGAGQEVSLPVTRGKSCVFYVVCQNAGTGTDRFTVSGGRSGSGYRVQYFLGTAIRGEDNVDITSTVTAGGYTTADLGAGGSTGEATLLRIVVTADKLAAKGAHSVLVTYTSQSNQLKTDTVKATFTIK